jgi:hypothetical protein
MSVRSRGLIFGGADSHPFAIFHDRWLERPDWTESGMAALERNGGFGANWTGTVSFAPVYPFGRFRPNSVTPTTIGTSRKRPFVGRPTNSDWRLGWEAGSGLSYREVGERVGGCSYTKASIATTTRRIAVFTSSTSARVIGHSVRGRPGCRSPS